MSEKISLKKHLKAIIKLNDTHVREIIVIKQNASDKALELFSTTYEIRHQKLTSDIEQIRNETENYMATKKGESKVSDAAKIIIAGISGGLLTVIANYLINHP